MRARVHPSRLLCSSPASMPPTVTLDGVLILNSVPLISTLFEHDSSSISYQGLQAPFPHKSLHACGALQGFYSTGALLHCISSSGLAPVLPSPVFDVTAYVPLCCASSNHVAGSLCEKQYCNSHTAFLNYIFNNCGHTHSIQNHAGNFTRLYCLT